MAEFNCKECGVLFEKVDPRKCCSIECSALYQRKRILASRKRIYASDKEGAKQKAKEWYHANKEKASKARKIYVEKNKDRYWDKKITKKFGVTAEDYARMLEAQVFVCAICGHICKDKRKRKLCVDHCHTTGKVRGLLCSACNTGLGNFRDNMNVLLNAAFYIEESNA